MNARRGFGFSLVLLALAAVVGAGLARQWQEGVGLRTELELARLDGADLRRVQRENDQLRETQIPVAELEALRADREALLRLRAEFAALEKRAVGTGRE